MTVSVTPTAVWSHSHSDGHGNDDYDYYYEEEEEDTHLKTSRKTTPAPRRPETSRQQTTKSDHTSWAEPERRPANETKKYYPECGVAITNMIVGGLPAAEGRSQFEDATDWRAVFGSKQPTLTSDVKSQRKIDLIVRHPEFVNGGNYPNDIAMMRLEEPVDVSGFNIRHACLPSRDQPFLADSECWIMGWGETKGFEEQSVLQELDVKIRRNHACAARWGWKRILNSHVCVGNGDGGACN
nr:hypothetical protein BaRGS_002505 [Batillaria attramentaria]